MPLTFDDAKKKIKTLFIYPFYNFEVQKERFDIPQTSPKFLKFNGDKTK